METSNKLTSASIQQLTERLRVENTYASSRDKPSSSCVPKTTGKWFCPVRLQLLVNTFPPVWNFKPECYVLKFTPEMKHELYIAGRIMNKGYLEYHLGTVQVDHDNAFVNSITC